jgi:hypothetical protein
MGLGLIREEPETLQLLVSCRTNVHLKFENLSKYINHFGVSVPVCSILK